MRIRLYFAEFASARILTLFETIPLGFAHITGARQFCQAHPRTALYVLSAMILPFCRRLCDVRFMEVHFVAD